MKEHQASPSVRYHPERAMKMRSPTLEGFRAIFHQPSLGLAEISWRWSFGSAAIALLFFSFLEYLDTLPVTKGEIFLLRSRQPALVSQALAHILRGSGLRAAAALIVAGFALALGWIVISSLGRAASLKALREYFQIQIESSSIELPVVSSSPYAVGPEIRLKKQWVRSLMGLNSLRVAAALAAAVGCIGALVLAGAASPDKDPSPGSAMLIFLTLVMLVALAWNGVNWALSLASIFTAQERDTFSALTAAVDFYRRHTGPVLAAGTWFGLAHVVIFFVATSVVAFPLALAGFLPAGMVLGGVLLVTLLYFAVADFLHVGRLAAYIYILEGPERPPTPLQEAVPLRPARMPPKEEAAVDRDELILSDASGAPPSG
ncbi:MAG TPA: hypothetical protein VLW84_11200 [Terriglobales bacterium]|nr:hypothetical protein [Terriglobales bacterium]